MGYPAIRLLKQVEAAKQAAIHRLHEDRRNRPMAAWLLFSCGLVAVVKSQLSTKAIWAKWGFGSQNTRQCPYDVTISFPYAKWKFATGDEVFSSPAITQTGNIVFGSSDTNLYCLTSSGSQRWKFATAGAVYSSPAITQTGDIVFGSLSTIVFCLTSAGSLKWTFITRGAVYSSPAITQTGDIVFGSYDKNLYCLTSAGTLRWTFETLNSVDSSPAITQSGDIVFGSYTNMYCLTSEGSQRWNFTTGSAVYSSPAITPSGDIVFGSWDAKVYCLSSAGSLKWTFITGSSVRSSPAITQTGDIVFGSYDKNLYCLTSAGTLRWTFETLNSVYSSPTITQSGDIVFGSDDNYIYLLDSKGSLKWSFGAALDIRSSPVVTSTGDIVFGCLDKKLYYLTTVTPTASPTMPKLIRVNDAQILGVSAITALFLASVIYLIRNSLTPSSKSNFLSNFFGGGNHAEPKSDHDKLVKFRPLEILIPITLSLTAAGSNILQIDNFMTSGNASDKGLGGIMIMARLLVGFHGILLLTLTLNRESFHKSLVSIHLHRPFVWILIGFATLFDVSHLRFFPWRHSDFVERSRGYPTLSLLKWALFSSAANSLVQFSLSIAKGLTISSIVSFSLSLGSFLLTVTTAFMKLVAENIHSHKVVDEGDNDQIRETNAALKAKIEQLELELKEIKAGTTIKNPINSRLCISMVYPNHDDISKKEQKSMEEMDEFRKSLCTAQETIAMKLDEAKAEP